MPYLDPDAQREHGRLWAKKRRAAWLESQVCALCGSTEKLHAFGAKRVGLVNAVAYCDACCSHDIRGRALLPASLKPEPARRPTTRTAREERSREHQARVAVSAEETVDKVNEVILRKARAVKAAPKPKALKAKKQVTPRARLAEVADEVPQKKIPKPVFSSYVEYEAATERRERMRKEREERRKALGYGRYG